MSTEYFQSLPCHSDLTVKNPLTINHVPCASERSGSSVPLLEPSPGLSHENFSHDLEFYVNPSSEDVAETKNDQDASLTPSPPPAHPQTQPDHLTDVFFTREVLVDAAPPKNDYVSATAEIPRPIQATGSNSGVKQEFESKLSWVRRSLRRSLSSVSRIRRTSETHEPTTSPPTAGNIKTLQEYISKYSQYLPQQVTIAVGHSETGNEFSAGDVVNLHFIKRTTLVDIRVPDAGQIGSVLVPLHGCVEYSILYDPDNDIEKAKAGYTFQTVGDLLAKKSMPKVVCASEGFNSGNERSSIKAREVLLILKVKKRRFSGPPSLVVFSATCGTRKVLRSGCAGKFSTNPILTKLPMPHILKHFLPADIFPCKAMMFIGGSNPYVDQFWFNKELTLAGLVENESVIISSAFVNADVGRKVYDLPVSFPISVSFHDAAVSQDELIACTNDVYNNFNPSTVDRIDNGSGCVVLAVGIHSGHEKEGFQWRLNEPAVKRQQHSGAESERCVSKSDAKDQLASLLSTVQVCTISLQAAWVIVANNDR